MTTVGCCESQQTRSSHCHLPAPTWILYLHHCRHCFCRPDATTPVRARIVRRIQMLIRVPNSTQLRRNASVVDLQSYWSAGQYSCAFRRNLPYSLAAAMEDCMRTSQYGPHFSRRRRSAHLQKLTNFLRCPPFVSLIVHNSQTPVTIQLAWQGNSGNVYPYSTPSHTCAGNHGVG